MHFAFYISSPAYTLTVIYMKKATVLPLLLALCSILLSACAPEGYCNILLFTDNLNRINGNKALSLSSYAASDNTYRLIRQNEAGKVLFTAEENEKGELKKIRLTIAKVDEKGNPVTVTPAHGEFFRSEAAKAMEAFTLYGNEKCTETVKKILPLKSEDFSRTGELTMDAEEYHLVYYSNKLCCQFTVTNSFLEETESTRKPESRPMYGATANTIPAA